MVSFRFCFCSMDLEGSKCYENEGKMWEVSLAGHICTKPFIHGNGGFKRRRHIGSLSHMKREIGPETQARVDSDLGLAHKESEQRLKWAHD